MNASKHESLIAGRTKLNLGCGRKHLPDAVNLDVTPDTAPDVVHNLNQRPWPFPDNSFSEVLAYDVIEHLDDVIGTMEEIHRVSRDGAIIKITLPHFSSPNAFTDPTHRHYFGEQSFHYVTGEHNFSFYTRCRFRRRETNIIFHRGPLNKIVRRLANRSPQTYERRWAWMFPAWFLYFELETIKPAAGDPEMKTADFATLNADAIASTTSPPVGESPDALSAVVAAED